MNSVKIKAMTGLITSMYEKEESITAAAIVKKSQPKSSPTHDCFEWDDRKAGKEYRLEQARRWIRKIKIEVPNGDNKTKTFRLAYVPPEDGAGPGEYKRPSFIVKNPSEFERAMSAALADLNSAQERVNELKSAAESMGDENKAAILAGLMYTLQSAGDILRKLQ